MTLDMLEHLLGIILSHETVCGIDICGECQPDLPLPEYMEGEEKNERINHELIDFFRSLNIAVSSKSSGSIVPLYQLLELKYA